MFDGIFHQCLQHHRRHRLIKRIFVDLIFNLKPVFKTDIFQAPDNLLQYSVLFQRYRFHFFGLHTAAQNITQFSDGIPCPLRIFIDQCPNTVQCIKNKMWIDMRFDGFQFQFFYQGFQLQCIQLLLPAFFNIMIDDNRSVPREQ